MNSVRDYHDIAMEFADLGIRNRARGQLEPALAYFEQALDFELAAIAELNQSDGLAWSILHRSAGTLALGLSPVSSGRADNDARPGPGNPIRTSLRNCATCWSKSTSNGIWI